MFCKYCGKEISDSADICGYCGRMLKDREHDKPYELNNSRKISMGEVFGLAIAVLGILAIIYCGASIRDDMLPHGFNGILGNYQWPFSTYELSQIFKLILSILVFLSGVILWAVGRNTPNYALHVFLFSVIVIIVVVIIGGVMIKSREANYGIWGKSDYNFKYITMYLTHWF